MPAISQKQQKFMGLVLAYKRGEIPASKVSKNIKQVASSMSEKELEKYASTPHKGLPKKAKSEAKMRIPVKEFKKIVNSVVSNVLSENVDQDNEKEEPKMTAEEKQQYMEAISRFNEYGKSVYRQSNLEQTIKHIKKLVEFASKNIVDESGDWFDKVTIKRNMNELEKLDKSFDKVASEARALDERLHALYEDMGNILGRYYEIADLDPNVMKERLGNTTIKEAKKYDIGSGYKGNGLTIWNRAEEEFGDYKTIAHIGNNGELKIYDKEMPGDIKKMLQIWATSMKKGNKGPQY
jgi:hypothetical protein